MRKSILILVGVVLVALSVTNEAAARNVNVSAFSPNRILLMDRQALLRMASHYGLMIRRLRISSNEKANLAELASKGCGCAAAQNGQDDFGSCFSGCLATWHVNQTTVLACGGTCSVAGTGNPVAIGLCAACLGVGEWIVAGCAMKCVYAGIGGKEIGGFVSRNLKHKLHLPAESQTKSTRKTVGIRT